MEGGPEMFQPGLHLGKANLIIKHPFVMPRGYTACTKLRENWGRLFKLSTALKKTKATLLIMW